MKKLLSIVFLATLLFITKGERSIWAQEEFLNLKTSNTSCFVPLNFPSPCLIQEPLWEKPLSMAEKILAQAQDERVVKLRAYFAKHKSPLEPYAQDFVYYADTYDLDWRLVPAITGVESTFGKHMPKNSYNAYGWANGDYRFTSWENSIEHVSRTLREKYYNNGADTLPKIARRYAPPSKTWGGNVQFFMNKIEEFEIPEETVIAVSTDQDLKVIASNKN